MCVLSNDVSGHQMTAKSYTPIAGCGIIDLPEAAEYDRRWLIVDDQGQWISAAPCPAAEEARGARICAIVSPGVTMF